RQLWESWRRFWKRAAGNNRSGCREVRYWAGSLLGRRRFVGRRLATDEFWNRHAAAGCAGGVSSTLPRVVDVVVTMAQDAIEWRPASGAGLVIAQWAVALEANVSAWEERIAGVERDCLGLFTTVLGKGARMTGATFDLSVGDVAELRM